jgi:hypothetical protein
MTTDSLIEEIAERLYRDQSLAWSGKEWDWSNAVEEVKDRFRIHARNRTQPWREPF